jgi:hypothetical protein
MDTQEPMLGSSTSTRPPAASCTPDLKIGDILGNSDIPEASIIERLKEHAKKKGFVPVMRCDPGRRRIRMTCQHAGQPANTKKCANPKVRRLVAGICSVGKGMRACFYIELRAEYVS